MAIYIVGSGYLAMAFKLSLLGYSPLEKTLCPKYSIFSLKNSHFEGLFQSMELEAFQDCLQVFDEFLLCAQITNDIVQIG